MRLRKESRDAEALLADDHEELGHLLKELVDSLDHANTATVLDRLDIFWTRLAMHIRAEHLHLFPALLKRFEELSPMDQVQSPTATRETIAQLRDDHDFFMHELAAAIKAVRRLQANDQSEGKSQTMGEVRTRITAIARRLESHNQIEEELIYGLPANLLTPGEQRTLTTGIARELRNLPPRFHHANNEAADE